MTKPLHTRPFDLNHARAGAPIAGSNGEAVRVLIWDRKHPTHPIVLIEEDGDQEAVAFQSDGKTHFKTGYTVTELVMTPLGFIDGKPFFVGDEIEVFSLSNKWEKMAAEPRHKMRHEPEIRWPAPAPVYPETRMKYEELCAAGGTSLLTTNSIAVRGVANAALRHAIDAGQVVPAETVAALRKLDYADGQRVAFKHEDASRAARDMAIAEAVRYACRTAIDDRNNHANLNRVRAAVTDINLAAIIAGVKS